MFLQGMVNGMAVGSDIYMILTGWLCFNKTVSQKYYLSGIRVIVSYLFFSILSIYVNVDIIHTGMTWKSGILGILSFSTIPYAWYIEMWIGLFILSPYLNIWYKSLPNKHMKLSLIIILLSLCALPDFFNRYGRYYVPEFWEFIYPFAFYLSGCYIREYQPKNSRLILFAVIVVILLISPVATIVMGKTVYLPLIGSRSGFFMASIAISIFLMFFNIEIKKNFWRTIFKAISLRSLDIFLCSAILDFAIYPYFIDNYYQTQSQFGPYYFIIVPLIFIACFIIASIKRWMFSVFDLILRKSNIEIRLQNNG